MDHRFTTTVGNTREPLTHKKKKFCFFSSFSLDAIFVVEIFWYKFKAIFAKKFFVFEKFWFWGTYPGGGKCLDHKKKRRVY